MPILIADESGGEDIPDKAIIAEDAAAMEHADFMKNGSSYRPRTPTLPPILATTNVVAGVKRKTADSGSFAILKKPKICDDKKAVEELGEVSNTLVPLAESDLEQDTRTSGGFSKNMSAVSWDGRRTGSKLKWEGYLRKM
ncbi:hypothetical protein G6011_01783 [Alternaria panax]|uniref:Uncharacterized protein n=1 Tax=Alternaria panax TaxID=48097 RepID=A0AAD4IKL1_9PLEO|nr:hypothetical protein G6011_01783 [Alternaria panax]